MSRPAPKPMTIISASGWNPCRSRGRRNSEARMTDSRPAGGGANEDRVGARIFQTWKSKVTLPDNFAYWRSTLIDKNPSFFFTLWDDTDNRNFIAGHFPWFLAIYDRFPAEIYRADCVRYFHLYMYGGFYIDLDTECLQPLQKFVESQDVLLCRMGPYPDFSHAVPNAIMASRPREEFWLLVIAIIRASYGFGLRGAEALTGP